MPTNTSVASYDVYTWQKTPNMNYGTWTNLQLDNGSGQVSYSYLYFAGMPPHGATVFSATLSVFLRDTSTWINGPHTITARRVTGAWSESKLTWNSSGSSQLGGTLHPATASVTNGVDGQQVDIDVTGILSDVAAGSSYYGIRLEVDGTATTVRKLYGKETTVNPAYRPALTITWSRPPDAPSDLAPAGGQSVSLQLPTLVWRFKDPDADPQSQYQVQIGTDSTFATSELDTGWVTDSTSQLDLSTTAYAGLSDGQTKYWRVRATDSNGLISPWSDVASFRRDVKGTLVLSNPPNGGFVEETTPPITTTLTGRAQAGIAYTLSVQKGTLWDELWSTGRFPASAADGTAYTFNMPAGHITRTDATYRLEVWSYDGIDRVATPGDPPSVKATATFTFDRDATPTPITDLAVTPSGPGVELTFSRSTEPNYFALRVDGTLVFDRVVAGDFLTSTPGPSNFLTGDNADFETSKGTWANIANCTLSQITTHFNTGVGSLKMFASAAGDMTATPFTAANVLTNGLPCSSGETVTVKAYFQAFTSTTRACQIGAEFYNSSGTSLGRFFGNAVTDSPTSWVLATASLAPPAGTVAARPVVLVQNAAASESHCVDTVYIDNGQPNAGQASYAIAYHGATPNESHTFEVEAVDTNGGTVLKHSQGNSVVTTTAYVRSIWLVDDSQAPYRPDSPPTMVRVDGQDSQDMSIGESSNTYYAVGRRDPVTITDSIRGLEGSITGQILDDANGYVAAFRGMRQPDTAAKTYRLIYGTTNIPVQLSAMHLTPQPDAGGYFTAGVTIAQVGEFD